MEENHEEEKHEKDLKMSKLKKIWIIVGSALILISVFFFIKANRSDGNTDELVQIPQINEESKNVSVSGRYLLNGTIFWGRAIEKWSQRPDGTYDYAQPFSGLDTFGPEKYDAWIADHECPVLDIVIPFEVQVNTLQFNCPPEYLPEAAKFFDIVNLSNNHSGDKGIDGFETTRNNFITAGFQAFGHYDPSVKEDTCEIVALPIKTKHGDGKTTEQNLPVALCAWHYFGRKPLDGEVEHMKQYSEIMPVFAFVHMGAEYNTSAQPVQREIAHAVVDQGPEFVIANNPHWIQDSEVYKDTLIVYSTGNFIFDQLDYEGNRSVSIDVTITADFNDNIEAWIQIGKDCKAEKLHDNCLALAKKQGLKKIDFDLLFAAVGGDNTDHVTKKAGPKLQEAIEKRLNWAQTLKELGQDE
ncbi:MAG: CapA family protein [bacterium]|nr:CapA family protein [bacterium]